MSLQTLWNEKPWKLPKIIWGHRLTWDEVTGFARGCKKTEKNEEEKEEEEV